jgi:hypothetical protein
LKLGLCQGNKKQVADVLRLTQPEIILFPEKLKD